MNIYLMTVLISFVLLGKDQESIAMILPLQLRLYIAEVINDGVYTINNSEVTSMNQLSHRGYKYHFTDTASAVGCISKSVSLHLFDDYTVILICSNSQ